MAPRALRPAGIGATAGLLLLVTGCTAAAPTPTATVTVTSSPAVSSAPPATSAPGAATAVPGSAAPTAGPTASAVDPDAPAHQCADDDLAVSIRADVEGNGLSHRGFLVVFQNTGSARCELRGVPGVSVVGRGNGSQLGAPAERLAATSPPTVEVAPQGFASARLDTEQMDARGGVFADGHGGDPRCRVAPADGYRIYPPHSFRAVLVRRSGLFGCTTAVHWQTVGEVEPGDRVAGSTS